MYDVSKILPHFFDLLSFLSAPEFCANSDTHEQILAYAAAFYYNSICMNRCFLYNMVTLFSKKLFLQAQTHSSIHVQRKNLS